MHVAILWNINTETVKSEWYFTYYKLTIADIRSVMHTGRGVETTRPRGNWRMASCLRGGELSRPEDGRAVLMQRIFTAQDAELYSVNFDSGYKQFGMDFQCSWILIQVG